MIPRPASRRIIDAMHDISRFYGIHVTMTFTDVPTFHATYGDHRISIEIQSGHVPGYNRRAGLFPRRAVWLLQEWRLLHRLELLGNWERLRSGQPPIAIAPLV